LAVINFAESGNFMLLDFVLVRFGKKKGYFLVGGSMECPIGD